MNAIAERVISLETTIGSGGKRVTLSQPTSTSPVKTTDKDVKEDTHKLPSIVNELSELTQKWRKLEKIEDKTFTTFFKKYNESSNMIESSVELKSLLLSMEMKEAVVLSCHKDLQGTAKLLEHIHSLTSLLDKVPIQNLSQFLVRSNQLQLNIDSAAAVTASIHTQIDSFIDSYFQYITILSQKFLMWDAALTKYEQMVDEAIAQRDTSAK